MTAANSSTFVFPRLESEVAPPCIRLPICAEPHDRVTAVLGFSELLLEESYGSLSSQQKKILFNVVVAARDVRDILREKNERFVED